MTSISCVSAAVAMRIFGYFVKPKRRAILTQSEQISSTSSPAFGVLLFSHSHDISTESPAPPVSNRLLLRQLVPTPASSSYPTLASQCLIGSALGLGTDWISRSSTWRLSTSVSRNSRSSPGRFIRLQFVSVSLPSLLLI